MDVVLLVEELPSTISKIFSIAFDSGQENLKSDFSISPDPPVAPSDENQPNSSSLSNPSPNVESQLLENEM